MNNIFPLLSSSFADCAKTGSPLLTLLSPVDGVVVSQLNELHKSYIFMPRAERVAYFADQNKRFEMKSADQYPVPIEFSWQCAAEQVKDFTLILSESPDMSAPLEVSEVVGNTARLDNFKINANYYWHVAAEINGDLVCSDIGHFRTEDLAPRLIRIEKAPNVRDLGGRKAMRGMRVKQNMIFRAAGMNDNASNLYYTAEELKDIPEYAEEYAAKKSIADELVAAVQKCRQWLNEAEKQDEACNILAPATSREWVAFRPDVKTFDEAPRDEMLAKLEEIPADFLGAPPEKAVMDDKGYFTFPIIDQDAPAVFMQAFDAPSDGFLQLGCGADWYWVVRINGELIYDKRKGNFRAPVAANNFRLQIPVRAGKNLLTVLVRSGAGSWSWCCAPLPVTPATEILRSMIKHLETAGADLWSIVKGIKIGENRLTARTKKFMIENLGIKTDLDLRRPDECWGMLESPVGPEVEWIRYSLRSYAAMQSEEGREAFADAFKIFLDESKYPIITHCIAGQDRTGAVAFVLNGLLGVEEEELYLDWEVTGFWNHAVGFRHEHLFDKLVEGFDQWPGNNLMERIEAYIISLGFTREDIEKFRHLMLE